MAGFDFVEVNKHLNQNSYILQELIKQYCPPQEGLLCGNSVWQDRAFLRRFMPCLVDYLHYKMIDVTSIQQMIKRWYPNDKNIEFKKEDQHRALPDICESIAELNHYKKHFFINS